MIFLTSFDFFHICGDDTYLIVENLKEFLFDSQAWENSNKHNDRYVFAGFLYSWGSKKHEQLRHYLGGGSGYTLSAKALKAYAEGPLQVCETSIEAPNEDVHVSNCFYNYLSTDWIDTTDDSHAQRYHQLSVDKLATFCVKGRDNNKDFMSRIIKKSINRYNVLLHNVGAMHNCKQVYGISNSSVAFHKHLSPDYLRRYEVILYRRSFIEMCEGEVL